MTMGNTYELLDDRGTPLGQFQGRDAAFAALARLVEADPHALSDTFIAEFDREGQRVSTHFPQPSVLSSAGELVVEPHVEVAVLAKALTRPVR